MKQFLKTVIATAALGIGLATTACGSNMHIGIGDNDGVPLADLDMSGDAPTRLVLASPDKVVVGEGDRLDIKVSGDADAIEALRFNLEKGTLGIMREKAWKGTGTATIAVTMPPAREFVLAGSGDIQAASMRDKAEVNIAGSGSGEFASDGTVKAHVAGSGDVTVYGRADCKISAVGSGTLRCRGADSAAWDDATPKPPKTPTAPKAPNAPSTPTPAE